MPKDLPSQIGKVSAATLLYCYGAGQWGSRQGQVSWVDEAHETEGKSESYEESKFRYAGVVRINSNLSWLCIIRDHLFQ